MVLTGREKATIFLSMLGADVSTRVLRYLPNELADLIAAGINHLPTPSPEALSEVIGDFQSFLALPPPNPQREPEPVYTPPTPTKSYAPLVYERPQLIAFALSLLPEEEKAGALRSFARDRGAIEEQLQTIRANVLRPKLEAVVKEHFAGKIF